MTIYHGRKRQVRKETSYEGKGEGVEFEKEVVLNVVPLRNALEMSKATAWFSPKPLREVNQVLRRKG